MGTAHHLLVGCSAEFWWAMPTQPFLRYFRAEAGRALYEELGPISFVGAGIAGAGEAGLAVAAGGGSSSP